MASIFPRKNGDGSITWRVQIRRKGLPTFCTGFCTYEEANAFVEKCEERYCLAPENFEYSYLKSRREREFKRMKMRTPHETTTSKKY